MKKIILCTGGTGGHIFPMIALYEELKKNYQVKILTDQRALKYLDQNQDITIIPAESPYRNKGIFHFIKSILIIGLAFLRSLLIILTFKPCIIVGSGGYVSFPVLLVARLLRIKFFIYETNSVIGRVNKIFLKHCSKLLTGYEHIHLLPEKQKKKMIYVGQLVRSQFIKLSEKKPLTYDQNLNKKSFNILVLGGSQGAKIFGDKLPERFLSLAKKKINLSIDQQAQQDQISGVKNYYEKNISALKINNKEILLHFNLFTFSNHIEEFVKISDIVICRSGSSTLSELASANKPFIAVPLKNSLDNHQYHNAKYYLDHDCCWLVEDNDNMGFKIETIIENIARDKSILKKKIKNLYQLKKGNPIQNFINQITT